MEKDERVRKLEQELIEKGKVIRVLEDTLEQLEDCLLYTSPSPRDS